MGGGGEGWAKVRTGVGVGFAAKVGQRTASGSSTGRGRVSLGFCAAETSPTVAGRPILTALATGSVATRERERDRTRMAKPASAITARDRTLDLGII